MDANKLAQAYADRYVPVHAEAFFKHLVQKAYKAGYAEGYRGGVKKTREARIWVRPVTKAEVSSIRKEYVPGGASIKELAEKYNRSVDSIIYILRTNGIRKTAVWTEEKIKMAAHMLSIGKSPNEVARRFKTTASAVTQQVVLYKLNQRKVKDE